MPLLAPIFAAIGGWFSSFGAGIVAVFTLKGIEWSATKVFLLFLVGVVLPLVLYNTAVLIVTNLMGVGLTLVGDATADQQNLVFEITGIAGWIADQIYLPQALSTLFSAVASRFIIDLIPGIK
jgi:hypothetical protein